MNFSVSDRNHFRAQWAALHRAQTDLDYKVAKLAREYRDKLPSGKAGDEQFYELWQTEAGLSRCKAEEMLVRANTIKVVPDKTTWDELGGFTKTRAVLSLPRKDQPRAIAAAKAEGLQLPTIVRRMTAPPPPAPHVPPVRPAGNTPSPLSKPSAAPPSCRTAFTVPSATHPRAAAPLSLQDTADGDGATMARWLATQSSIPASLLAAMATHILGEKSVPPEVRDAARRWYKRCA